MCISFSKMHNSSKWNWDGDRIVRDSIVPSSRPPVGRIDGNYDIDVREFLVSERNVVMKRTLGKDIKKFISKLPGANWELFCARTSGSFDYRAHIITEYISQNIAYFQTNELDPWQFPEETLSLKSGDCEDRALLIASLLLASGISSFNVRVALGKFSAWFKGKRKDFDHVWVMYKNETGHWQIIEPTHARKVDVTEGKNEMPERAEYAPLYLFNDVHLWQVQPPSVYKKRVSDDLNRNWSKLNPKFAGWVHKSILNEALPSSICPPWVLKALNSHFTSYLWQKSLTVDDVDNPGAYDPRDHFDNGYIDEGWELVNDRLKQFQNASLTNLDAFHLAAHAIADFYAHSSYGHFGAVINGKLKPYDPDNPGACLPLSPDYGQGTTFDLQRFSRNANVNKGTASDALKIWGGEIISGRYGQKGDSQSLAELATFIPSTMLSKRDFSKRGLLPHHNEIAVDEDKVGAKHKLYTSDKYAQQYHLRYDAAVRHIRKAFRDNWSP